MTQDQTAPQQRENKMGTMPVNRLLINMSLPMMISMLVQAMYNIVDSIFVSRINENALTAVSLAFPIQSLIIAVTAGTCVGMNALLSRSLGEKKQDQVNLAATNGIFLSVCGFAVFFLLGLLFSGPYFRSQTPTPEVQDMGITYLRIILCCSAGIFIEITFERILQATGRTLVTMFTQMAGAIFNIIFDPILIFGLFGFPKMGIAGAALATVLGQCLSGLLAVLANYRINTDVRLNFHGFRPHGRTILTIYAVGVPSIIMQSIGSVMVFFMNRILIAFSETAVSVLGIYFKLQSFIFMPVFGLNNGFIPIVAYNFGARSRKRIMQTYRAGVVVAVLIMLVGLITFQLAPDKLLMLFNASPHMLSIGVPALRVISLSFLFAGYCIVTGSMFQALGNGVYSLLVSVARQLLCLVPAAALFARFGGLHLVWYAFPLAEVISLTLSTVLMVRIYRQKLARL